MKPFSVVAGVLMAAAISLSAQGAQEPDVPWQKLRDLSQRYLDVVSSPSEVKNMERRLRAKAAQRVQDRDQSEDVAMRDIMLDWAAGVDLKSKDKKTIVQACFYFVLFIDNGYVIPSQIRTRLTPENVDEIFRYLEGEISANAGRKS